jgi:tRNA pseudouridine38-40 synthase
MRYKIIVEYDGSNFYGWQRQSENPETIQEYLEKAVCLLSGEKVEVFASGRTDAGVHALNQVVHFDLEKCFSNRNIVSGLNHFLSLFFIKKNINLNRLAKTHFVSYYNHNCIMVKSCEVVDENFHARFSSKMRHYRYIILNQSENSTFDFNRAWLVRNKLNIDDMRLASKNLLGKHDFTSFRSTECQSASPMKTLDECEINVDGNRIIFELSAKSFLHHMVRNIVGTLKEIGDGKRKVDDVERIILARNRQACGVMAPACGLYFVGVEFKGV